MWWEIGRENSRLETWDLSTVDEDVLAELTTPKYELMDSYGKIKIEPKDEVKKRLDGASPDRAEALLLAFIESSVGGNFNGALTMAQATLFKSPTSVTVNRNHKRHRYARMGLRK